MLRELRIRDIAIIDDLAISFGPGLNVITGETGAGKSILLQSLSLLCGARGAVDLIRSDADEATIEGLFECSVPDDLREAFGLRGDDEILVRRHLSRTSKGRIYVNGSPVTLGLLTQLGEHLVHIYGQHDQALLLRPASHLALLDAFGDTGRLGEEMADAYAAFASARQRRDEIQRTGSALLERRELLEFQHAELIGAAVEPGEEQALREERERLRHAERLLQVCRTGESALYSGQSAIGSTLGRLGNQLTELGAIAPQLAAVAELVESSRAQIEEAALQLRIFVDHLHADPARLDGIEERLGLLARLGRKFHVPTDELPAICASLARDLAALDTQVSDASTAEIELAERRARATATARELSAARRAAAAHLQERMVAELAALGMRDAVFRVVWEGPSADRARLGATGSDVVEFHLTTNAGEEPKPLARIASGGELSRIMLALKALTASAGETPILIFDEVDSGIGGAVADAVARRLKALARNRQLLCITHLPQIAAHGDQHFAVEKFEQNGRTISHARILAADERVFEVSRMLGGMSAQAEAQRYARRLLAEARRST
jgi:DNA repair protein RecN (Recombination protein N)